MTYDDYCVSSKGYPSYWYIYYIIRTDRTTDRYAHKCKKVYPPVPRSEGISAGVVLRRKTLIKQCGVGGNGHQWSVENRNRCGFFFSDESKFVIRNEKRVWILRRKDEGRRPHLVDMNSQRFVLLCFKFVYRFMDFEMVESLLSSFFIHRWSLIWGAFVVKVWGLYNINVAKYQYILEEYL